jgi:hypothetical protein
MVTKDVVRGLTLVCLLGVVACSSDKGPAEQAIKAADTALSGVKVEAAQYVPEQVQPVEAALQGAKEAFAKGDYTAALNSAKDLEAKAKELGLVAAAKKAEVSKQWDDLAAGVPEAIRTVQGRVDALAQAKKLPAGMDKAKLEELTTALVTLTQVWAEATDAFTAGKVAEAVDKGRGVKDKVTELKTTLGS